MVREIENNGTKLEESDEICHLLLIMPEIFEIETLTSNKDANAESLEFVKARLFDTEFKFRNTDSNDFNNKVSLKADLPFRCYEYGRKGHKRSDCIK